MLRKMTMLAMLLVFAFGTAAIAGCGGDDEKSSSPKTETTESGDSGGGGSTDPDIQAAVDSCKQTIDAQAQLEADTKADLKEVCDKAASGDIKDAQEASVEVCKKIAEEMVPDEAAREQVISQCEAAASNP